MKYLIAINQRATVEYNERNNTDLYSEDIIVFDYLFWICTSPSDKVATKRIQIEDGEYTWIDYKHLAREMPLVKNNSLSSISRIIKKLEGAGLIQTHIKSIGSGKRKYVKITPQAELLLSDVYVKV